MRQGFVIVHLQKDGEKIHCSIRTNNIDAIRKAMFDKDSKERKAIGYEHYNVSFITDFEGVYYNYGRMDVYKEEKRVQEIMNEFSRLIHEQQVLVMDRAIEYMKADSSRSIKTCKALAMGYENPTGLSTTWIKKD